jgi:hypothetical protein
MRRVLLVASAALVAAVLAAPPAGATTPTERKLQRQVSVLSKDVKTLKKQVKKLNTDLNNVTNGLVALNLCVAAATADALQGTWAKFPTAGFPTEPTVNDLNACSSFRVQRAANQPTTNVLQAIINIFRSTAFRAAISIFS